jgi:hypothetical protein
VTRQTCGFLGTPAQIAFTYYPVSKNWSSCARAALMMLVPPAASSSPAVIASVAEGTRARAALLAAAMARTPTRELLFLWIVGLMCGGVLLVTLKGGS